MSAETGEAVDKGGGRLVSGREALVRLPIAQRALDRRAGHRTAGFITGYRGSPLGGYDSELWRSRALLEAHDIVFRPGLNEDMAATAVWGTQQVHFAPRPKVEGVFALWYGKGPGVDRSGDPIKHANLQGVSALGGVVLAFGDDHAGKSSTTAHQSDIALAAHGVPILYPASVAEIIDLGLAGFALSRFAGVLVGLKLVNETAEATGDFAEAAERAPFVVPEAPEPPGGVHIRKEFLAVQEQDVRLVRWKLPRAQAFAYANRLDGIVFGASRPKFVVACAGKTYADVLGALDHLGLDQDRAEQLGIGLYKVAMIYPLEPRRLAEIAESADEILFVEEKRPHMEEQARSQLFNWPVRPQISGKADPAGRALLPADTVLDALMVAARRRQTSRGGFGSSAIELRDEAPWFHRRSSGDPHSARGALIISRRRCRRARSASPALAVTEWRSSIRSVIPCQSAIWEAKGACGWEWRLSPKPRTSSKISATGPTIIPDPSRSAPLSRRGSTSPTKFSSTMRWP